jgi:hypothetical protein
MDVRCRGLKRNLSPLESRSCAQRRDRQITDRHETFERQCPSETSWRGLRSYLDFDHDNDLDNLVLVCIEYSLKLLASAEYHLSTALAKSELCRCSMAAAMLERN